MPDREKIIGELEYCKNNLNGNACKSCSRGGTGIVTCKSLIDDVLILLKEQELKLVIYKENYITKMPVSHCPRCNECIDLFYKPSLEKKTKFCPICGQEVKWE